MPTVAELRSADQKLAEQRRKLREAIKGQAPKPEGALTTQIEIGQRFGVSRQTVQEWVRMPGFPVKSDAGYYEPEKIDAFLKDNHLGAHRKNSETISEAKHRLLEEKAERERIARVTDDANLQQLLEKLVLLDDVCQQFERIASTATTIIDQLPDMLDRELPAKRPSAAAWGDVRERCLEGGARIATQFRAIMEELGPSDSDGDPQAE